MGRPVGTAVRRNRVRRRLRAAVAQLDGRLDAGAYLFGAEGEAVTMDFTELCDSVEAVVRDAGALR